MPIVSLHGAVPVYVQVDTDTKEVRHVCTSDEEFFYVGERLDDEEGVTTLLKTSLVVDPPIAYDEHGNPFTDAEQIGRAIEIAEGSCDVKAADWPAWSFGW